MTETYLSVANNGSQQYVHGAVVDNEGNYRQVRFLKERPNSARTHVGIGVLLGASHAVQLKEWDPSAPNFGPYVRPCRWSESDRILHLRKRHSLTVVHPQLNGQDTCFPKFLEPPTYSTVV